MPGSYCLLKWTVSRSCFSCRQGPEHYCTISAWVEELVEGCGDSSGDWDEDLIVMNMEIWIHLHDEPIYRYAAQPFYKELLALQGMKVSRCFLKAGQNLLLMSEIHFSVCCFSGWGKHRVRMDGVCLLACLLIFFLPHLMITFLGNLVCLHECLHRFFCPSWHR